MGYIYRAENTISKKSYIGQTKRDVQIRWWEHCVKEKGIDTILTRAIKKYGEDCWDVTVLEECADNELDEREKYWIKYYDSYRNGYNATLGGQGVTTIDYDLIITDFKDGLNIYDIAQKYNIQIPTVKYILDSHKINYESKLWRTEIPVEMIDIKTLSVIQVFPSLTKAVDSHPEWNIATLSGAINGRRASAYGYYWKKVDDNTKQFKPTIQHKTKVLQYSEAGEFLKEYDSIAEANRTFNKPSNHKGIGNCLAGRAKTAFGFVWKRAKE